MLSLFRRYVENWRTLRQAVNVLGAECETWSYEQLDRDASEQPVLERSVDGKLLRFQLDRWQKAASGDLILCIDADGLPTLAGVKPTYQFAKRPDGSVYYP